jgi:hypothetical protein
MKKENFKMKMTIEEILKLTPQDEGKSYIAGGEIGFLSPLDTIHNEIPMEFYDNFTFKSYVEDQNNDCRSRSLEILFYRNRPFAMYQYMGRGEYENEAIIDKEVYKEFISNATIAAIENTDIKIKQKSDMYEIKNYDRGTFIIKKNKIISINKDI